MQVLTKKVVFCNGCGAYTFYYDEKDGLPVVYKDWRVIQEWQNGARVACSDECERDILMAQRAFFKQRQLG